MHLRMCVLSTACSISVDESVRHSLRSFYFLVDTLRSIHFHTPSTVEPTWSVRVGAKAEYDFRSLCESLILDKCALPKTLSTDEYFLILTSILSDINTLSSSVGPLTGVCRSINEEATRMCDRGRPNLYHDDQSRVPNHSPHDSVRIASNPYVPFTADHEFNRLRRSLARALEIWMTSFRHRGSIIEEKTDIYEATILPLFHFCRLLLEIGPAYHVVPALAGYVSGVYNMPLTSIPLPCEPHKIGVQFSDEAIRIALDILECIEASRRPANAPSANGRRRCHPLWYPLAVFYGALVVWGRVREDEASNRSSHILVSLRRMLHAFHSELEKLREDWGCASQMTEVVANLIS